MQINQQYYSVDIMFDIVEKARERMFEMFFVSFVNNNGHLYCQQSVHFISEHPLPEHLIIANNDYGKDLIITKWAFDDKNRSVFLLKRNQAFFRLQIVSC